MMQKQSTVGAFVCAVLFGGSVLMAQVPQVRVSPYAEIKQGVGIASVSMTYHRPGVKGRTIWGGLLKYDEVWRAGANEPTLITFSDDVRAGGAALKAGTYRLVVVPKATGAWTVIFNSEVKNWGTVYDSTYDAAKVAVMPAAAPHEEWMSFAFEDLSATSATLVLRWEKVALKVPLQFDTEAGFAAAAASAETNVWRVQNNYARFILESGGDPAKAMAVIDKTLKTAENTATLRTKAEILAKQGKYKDAVTTMEKAIAVGKAQNPRMNSGFLEDMIKEWKTKK